ncbi:MAG: GTPase ObgE [Acholeplasmataceae bacterium]
MFVDEIKVEVTGGKGGNGMCAYRREKFVEFGGPWGGSGGKGGDVIFLGDSGMTTLYPFRYMRHIKAPNGVDGQSKGMTGAQGDPKIIKVPLGTIVKKEDGQIIGDITEHNQKLVIAKGGKGGRGNMALATGNNPTPNYAEKGDIGEHLMIHLELQVLADIGFIGFPSVGKSSIVSVISNAKTKIADYPFTTTSPILGMVQYDDVSFAVADLPGLIEEAHLGVGLGIQFLKHLSRCRVFVHVLDATRESYKYDYEAILKELRSYDATLIDRKEILVINKAELLDEDDRNEVKAIFGDDVLFISTFTKENIQTLIQILANQVQTLPPITSFVEAYITYTLEDEEKPIEVSIIGDQVFEVTGDQVMKLYQRSDLSQEESAKRFARQLKALGVDDLLRKKGAKNGATVYIDTLTFEFKD